MGLNEEMTGTLVIVLIRFVLQKCAEFRGVQSMQFVNGNSFVALGHLLFLDDAEQTGTSPVVESGVREPLVIARVTLRGAV